MKPIILELMNIGPFVGKHTIDFSLLDDFFLISGKTGSGKTTILDSITYAFYGVLPGARKQVDIRCLRSDFCDSNNTFYVSLIFLLNNKYYKIIRHLPFVYQTKRNNLKEESETCELYSLTDKTDSNPTLLFNKKQETDDKIRELLQLSPDEFSKIVLLPQGEFAVFLRQNSSDRKQMLEKLFPVSMFSGITDYIKNIYNNYSIKYNSITQQQHSLLQTFNLSDSENKEKTLSLSIETNKNTIKQYQKRLLEVNSSLITLNQQLSDYLEYNKLIAKHVKLTNEKLEIEEAKQKLIKASQAADFKPLTTKLELLKENEKNLSHDLTQTKTFLEQSLKQQELIENQENDINKLIDKNKNDSIKKNEITKNKVYSQNLVELLKQIVTIENDFKSIFLEQNKLSEQIKKHDEFLDTNSNATELKQSIIEKLTIANVKLSTLNKNSDYYQLTQQKTILETDINEQNNLLSKVKLFITEIEEQIENEKNSSIAGLLAKNLQENSPCPVCGSLEHPKPAKEFSTSLSLQDKLSTQKKLFENQTQTISELNSKKNILEGKIQGLQESIDLSIVDNKDTLIQEISELNEKSQTLDNIILQLKHIRETRKLDEHQLLQLTENNKKNSDKLIALEERKQNYINELKTFIQITDNTDFLEINKQLNDQLSILDIQLTENQKKIDNYNKSKELYIIETTKYLERKNSLQDQIEQNNKHLSQIDSELSEKLSNSIFTNIQEIHANEITENERLFLENKIKLWQKEFDSTEALLKQKESCISDTEENLNNTILSYQNEATTLNQNIEEQQSQIETTSKELAVLLRDKEDYTTLENQRKELQQISFTYEKLFNVLSGKNPKKTDITSWVLSMYLEEIIYFANKRLEKISESRYSMQLLQEKEGGRGSKGLDIQIFDAYTGKSRPCNTLSGGETFMASISLALAISDSVASRNGGIQLDSLFIDEGFGSLDDVTLEKAISILDDIRENRQIGIISHVGDLQTRIKSAIHISKSTTGSKISLISCSDTESSL